MNHRIGPPPIGLSEFAFAVSARPGSGDWSVLAVEHGESPAIVAQRLVEQLRIFDEREVHLIDATDNAAQIVEAIRKTPMGVLVLRECKPLSRATLQRLDFARSRLIREDASILVLRLPTLQALLSTAPNLASFLGNFMYLVAPQAEQLSPEERGARLDHLRKRFELADEQVVELAKQGQLPSDPEFAEWLVLLGHGGLIGSA